MPATNAAVTTPKIVANTAGTMSAIAGAITRAARKPSTTLGRLAITSMPGLTNARTFACMNCEV